MNIAKGNVINMAPAGHDWTITFDVGDETGEVVCPVIGWATVAQAHMKDGTVTTAVEPVFVWGSMVWTESELREHTPGLGGIEIRAREITRAATKENQ